MLKYDLSNKYFLAKFLKIKKMAQWEFLQLIFTLCFIFSAFVLLLFDKSLASGCLVGAGFLLSFVLIQRASHQLIKLIEELISHDSESIKTISEIKEPHQ